MVVLMLAWLLATVHAHLDDLQAYLGSGRGQAVVSPETERVVAEARQAVDDFQGDPRPLLEARERLGAVLRVTPRYAPAHVQVARITYRLGYLSGTRFDPAALALALRQVDHALALDDRLPEAYRARGWIVLRQGNTAEARRMAERAEVLEPGSLAVLWLEAEIDDAEGQLDRARDRYAQMLDRAQDTSTRIRAYGGLASLECALKRLEACEAAHRALIELDPGSAWAKGNYASFLTRRERWDEAITYAEAAIRQMDYPAARSVLATAHLGKAWTFIQAARGGDEGALPSARRHLDVALVASAGRADAFFGLGAYNVEVWRLARTDAARRRAIADAEAAFRRAYEMEPTNNTFREWLGRSIAERRRLEAASGR